jgi:7-carboxy-7-deazaguanine synthase
MKTYKIKEIFGPTLQGEGSATGTAVHFVRFSGCNMWNGRPESRANSQCPFCDTDFFGGEMLSKEAILNQLVALGYSEHVVLSGGEPGLQVDEDLISFLSPYYTLHIETNGTVMLPDGIKHITVSPKVTAGKLIEQKITDLKLLFPSIRDGMGPEDFINIKAENYFLQPVDDENHESNIKGAVEYVLANPKWRLSLQTHKMLGLK